MILYYITDRTQFPGSEAERQNRLLDKIAETCRFGIDFIQLREKDLPIRDFEKLALEAVRVIRENSNKQSRAQTRLLINSRTDVAIACEARGVHLTAHDISSRDVRKVWAQANPETSAQHTKTPVVARSCHTLEDVSQAKKENANFAVFGPVFEKKKTEMRNAEHFPPAGLDLLREACAMDLPVLALGGINYENAGSCMEAGASGIAAIRLFQQRDICEVIGKLESKSR
jgi:thiamine-phosphate pyrophosphorylase